MIQQRDNWMNDDLLNNPELKGINPMKLQILNNFANEASKKSTNDLLPLFLSVMQNANSSGLAFSDNETELIMDVLKKKMSSKDIKKIETIRNVAKMLNKQ